MGTAMTEGGLEFTFPDTWRVVKYDESRHYAKVGRIQCTSGVDFVCRSSDGSLLLIEVKDFRFPGAKPGKKQKCGQLELNFMDQLAWKARDTLAGLTGARLRQAQSLEPFHDVLCATPPPRVTFVLFMELPSSRRLLPGSKAKSDYQKSLAGRLRPLGLKVLVYDKNSLPPSADWHVRSA